MKKILFGLLLSLSLNSFSQIGIKGGINFANVSNAADINGSSQTGFHIGLFLAPSTPGVLGYRTELLFSRQGYNYKSGTKTGDVKLDYIQMGQLMAINITKYFSLMLGAQTGYLISGKVDSSTSGGNGTNDNAFLKLYNRFDYGYAVGAEVHPLKGLIVGVKYNVSLNKLYEDLQTGQQPSFTAADAKNNVVMVSVGWRFGKAAEKPKASTSNM